ncbi:MAG: VWA domain-containing protein [Spirochaetes bacterium]|nr:VWA domain-containing protein [Spirochaetota bacterium]
MNQQQILSLIHDKKEIQLLTENQMITLKKKDIFNENMLENILSTINTVDFPVLTNMLPIIQKNLQFWQYPFIVVYGTPHEIEIDKLINFQKASQIPVSLQKVVDIDHPVLLGFQYQINNNNNQINLKFQFSDKISQLVNGEIKFGERRVLLTKQDIQSDDSYQLSITKEDTNQLQFDLTLADQKYIQNIVLINDSEADPAFLKISQSDKESVFDKMVAFDRKAISQLGDVDYTKYKMILFDGIPLAQINQEQSQIIKNLYEKKVNSLFFISDSPSFGEQGKNPLIEDIIPVELVPSSLKYLPDIAILLLLDVSASMLGDKLSLAKVSALEMLSQLKENDKIGFTIFWDEFEKLTFFEKRSQIKENLNIVPLAAKGGTDLYQPLLEGINDLIDQNTQDRHIIIMTDGNTRDGNFDYLLELAIMNKISISTISIGDDVNYKLLNKMAKRSGGNYYHVKDNQTIPSIIFEDRKKISRSHFSQNNFNISNVFKENIATITGMSIYSAKPERSILYQNEFYDPLFIFEDRGKHSVFMFLSDIYGYYTNDFFQQKETVNTFRRIFDSLQDHEINVITLTESYQNLAVSFHHDKLYQPKLLVFRDNQLLVEKQLNQNFFNHYFTQFKPEKKGQYRFIIQDQDHTIGNYNCYYNGCAQGTTVKAEKIYKEYQPLIFRWFHIKMLYLILFFIFSVRVTYLNRRKV